MNIPYKLAPVVFLLFSYHFIFTRFWEAFNQPRYWRQRELISTVNTYSSLISYETIHNNKDWIHFSENLKLLAKPSYLILYDSSNVELFLNFICNLELVSNETERIVAVSLDDRAHLSLHKERPSIPSVYLDFETTKKTVPKETKNRDLVIKQLILLFRSRICASLARRGISFWSMQQDTLWLEDFAKMNLENQFENRNLIFDVVGSDQNPHFKRMEGWICGSTFFVRGNPLTYQFFMQVEEFTKFHQSPDSSIMTYLCGHHQYKCEKMSRNVIMSSNYFHGNRNMTPAMIQVDTYTADKTKMEAFRSANFTFRDDHGKCTAMDGIKATAKAAFPELRYTSTYSERWIQTLRYKLKEVFNIDPFNHKLYLQVYYSLI